MNILPSPEIWHRDDFPLLCEWRKLYRCVEVGVDRGEFSQTFLQRCYGCTLYLGVDSYVDGSIMNWDRTADITIAAMRYERFASKAKLIRCTSEQAARVLPRSSKLYSVPMDFVYLDADHSKQGVTNDIHNWWPLISERGILAGHDYWMPSGDFPGVGEAVREFAAKHNLTVYHTTETADSQSWYIYKNGLPRDWIRNDGSY